MSAAILLVAYQCAPGMGSVSQIGWEWFSRLAARRPVTLVTHVRNRAAIEAQGPLPASADILWIDTEWFAGPLYRLARRLFPRSEHSSFLLASLDYFPFEWRALSLLRQAQRRGRVWSLVHLVTPVTLAAPTRLHKLGLAVLRGPLNCGLKTPPGFARIMQAESSWLFHTRAIARLADWLLGSSRHTEAFLVASAASEAALPASARARAQRMIENGIEPQHYPPSPWPPLGQGQPLRVAFVGRLIPLKALDLLIDAIARLREAGHAIELDVAGDGPMRGPWEARAQERGIAARFHGMRSQAEVAALLRASHLLCLPSVRESGGAVLLEAMACARPVVALAWGGPAELVDDEVGALLPMPDSETVIAGLAATLLDCIADPQAWARRGAHAHQRASSRYSWAAKIDAAEALYQKSLERPAKGWLPSPRG